MTDHSAFSFWSEPAGPRLPRIALMGEFSAGKSTLANLMIGTDPLPVQVVATQLPPVWISYGTQSSVIVDLDGNESPCDLAALQDIAPEETAFIRFFCEAEILRQCELIDMPGISDPNMDSAVWERMMPLADGVLWCSPSTQAWRQSEAAVWDGIEDRVRDQSLLMLTRGDMLLSERDKSKVLKRVKMEAGSDFADILMVSLSQARDAGDDEELWARSGADAFVARFLSLIEGLSPVEQGNPDPTPTLAVMPNVPEKLVSGGASEPVREPAIVPRRPKVRREVTQTNDVASASQVDPMSFMPKFS